MRNNQKFSSGTGVVPKYEKRFPENHILPGLQGVYQDT